MQGIETFESPLLADVQINSDGTLKQSGKQNVKFYNKKRLSFRARPLWVRNDDGEIAKHPNGKPVRAMDERGKPAFEIDPKTGIPFKDAFEEEVLHVRVETKGDTNIKDDVANAMDKMQHHRQYRFFMSGKIPDGHSIDDFEFIQPQTLAELHTYGVHTLEQVAEMDEVACEQIKDQSGFELRDIAAQWLKMNSPTGQSEKAARMEKELARVKRELENLKANGLRVRSVDVQPAIEQEASEPESVVETMELTPEQLRNRGGRPRKV
jgi:hypothetical protein